MNSAKSSRTPKSSPKTTPFQERVYAKLRDVPRGRVTTYGALARVLKTSARAIGQAMRRNPYAPEVPCHRVVAAVGSIGGFGGNTSGKKIREKAFLLKRERINTTLKNEKLFIDDFEKRLHHW